MDLPDSFSSFLSFPLRFELEPAMVNKKLIQIDRWDILGLRDSYSGGMKT